MKPRNLIFLTAILAALLAVAPGASAITGSTSTSGQSASSLKVLTTPTQYLVCMPDANTIRAYWSFKAKIKRKGIAAPKKVKIVYKVTDLTTNTVVGSETLYLKPSKWKKDGREMDYATGHTFKYFFKQTFRAPGSGRTITAKSTQTATMATSDELIAQGAPACPAAVG